MFSLSSRVWVCTAAPLLLLVIAVLACAGIIPSGHAATEIPAAITDFRMHLTAVEALIWVLVAGAFGGLADGTVVRARQEHLRLEYVPYRLDMPFGHGLYVELGFLGHMLIGATSSIAVFTVIDALSEFRFEFHNLETMDFMRFLALGVLSGFAGIRILDPTLDRLLGQLRGLENKLPDMVTSEVRRAKERSTEIAELQARGNEQLSQFDVYTKLGQREQRLNALQKAYGAYNDALRIDSDDEVSLRGKARVLRRLAQLSSGEHSDDADKIRPGSHPDHLWKEAIEVLDAVLKKNEKSANSYYNRACYLVLWKKKERLSEALNDLKKAIDINQALAGVAKDDPDFALVQEEPQFKELVRQNMQARKPSP